MPTPRGKEPPRRIQIQRVAPQIDGGRYAVKRTVGDPVDVSADVFRDGHEVLGRRGALPPGRRAALARGAHAAEGNDRWTASLRARRAAAAGSSPSRRGSTASRRGGTSSSARSTPGRRTWRASWPRARALGVESLTVDEALRRHADRPLRADELAGLEVDVDRGLARFGSWYELFPRSWGGFKRRRAACCRSSPSSASTSSTCRRSTRSAARTARAATTRSTAGAGRPGQPLGDRRGGGRPHRGPPRARHARRLRPAGRARPRARRRDRARLRDPVLARPPVAEGAPRVVPPPAGRDAQVRREPAQALPGHLQRQLRLRGLAGALGGAARRRPLLDRPRRAGLPRRQPAHEAGAVLGVADRRRSGAPTPRSIFLAEAFTRPAMMKTLAKIGFNQSYTYFTWRNTKAELLEFMTELARRGPPYFRPNFFANTPDILHGYLQAGGRPAFEARLVLAATLSPSLRHLLGLRALRERARCARAARSTSTRRSTR